MKKTIEKLVASIKKAEIYADHTAIKGNKSGGVRDSSSYKDWAKDNKGTYDSVN